MLQFVRGDEMEWSLSHFLFLSVLRQFKIVKPTRQQGEKKQALKKQKCLFMFYG
jgi:hypothetical protein